MSTNSRQGVSSRSCETAPHPVCPLKGGGNQTAQLCLAIALIACGTFPALADDDGPLTIADLAAYRAALEPTSSPEAPATFRDLWDRPAEFRGRRVAVGGRVGRVFHDGPVGQFPALAEVWVYSPASDPLCLVFPESKVTPAPKPGDVVRFEGTFLRRVKYRGGDVDRLAPLIVGPSSPRVEQAAPPTSSPIPTGSPFDGMFVLVLGGIVALGLLRAHLRRPSPRPIVDGPPPEFQDGPP